MGVGGPLRDLLHSISMMTGYYPDGRMLSRGQGGATDGLSVGKWHMLRVAFQDTGSGMACG